MSSANSKCFPSPLFTLFLFCHSIHQHKSFEEKDVLMKEIFPKKWEKLI